MIEHEIIPPFSQLWLIMNSISLLIIIGVITLSIKIKDYNQKVKLGFLIGIILLTRAIITHPYQIFWIERWTLTDSLPLHLCGISSILSSLLLFRFNQFLYEFLILLSIPGAIQALITPEFTLGIDNFFLVEYFISHGGIILSGLYLTFVLGNKPRLGAWKYVIIRSQLLIVAVHLINIILGSNYIYTRIKPIVDNPLIIGDWPYYYIGFEVLAVANIILFYYMFRKLTKNKEGVLA
tara:strand:- start:6847 stop:7557 length:711 start_codon:yes stop_codon:yes gene_type:complete